MTGATFGLWAFGVFCGGAVVWFIHAYREYDEAAKLTADKEVAKAPIDPSGHGGPGPVDPK